MKLTIENICTACESNKKPCIEPCDVWYRCLEQGAVDDKELLQTEDK